MSHDDDFLDDLDDEPFDFQPTDRQVQRRTGRVTCRWCGSCRVPDVVRVPPNWFMYTSALIFTFLVCFPLTAVLLLFSRGQISRYCRDCGVEL